MRFVFWFLMANRLIYVDLFRWRRIPLLKDAATAPYPLYTNYFPYGAEFSQFPGIATALSSARPVAIFFRRDLYTGDFLSVYWPIYSAAAAALPYYGGGCRFRPTNLLQGADLYTTTLCEYEQQGTRMRILLLIDLPRRAPSGRVSISRILGDMASTLGLAASTFRGYCAP